MNFGITLPYGNTLRIPIKISRAEGERFYSDDYAVIKVRDGLRRVVWSGVFNLGDGYDEKEGAAMIEWEINAADSAKIKEGAYKWDMAAHIGARVDHAGRPVDADTVITPAALILADFKVERIASHDDFKCGNSNPNAGR